ncbi:MAG: O-antigen ligase family protein [Candidatus Moranbacteria bacterium]|nr:O-antigen ligase family protein [Candidatus Moranbacteria bacterium]
MEQGVSVSKANPLPSTEGVAFAFLAVLLSIDALVNASFGFSLPVFLATIVPSVMLSFFFPRAGLAASVSVTVLFERFFTLVPVVLGEATYKLYPLDVVLLASFSGMIATGLLHEGRRLRPRMSDLFLVAFFVLVTAIFLSDVTTRSEGIATAFSTWKNYVFYGSAYFAVAAATRSIPDLRAASRVFVGSVAVALTFLVIGIVRGGGLWTEFTPLSTSGTRFLAFPHAFYYSLAFLVVMLGYSGSDTKASDRDPRGTDLALLLFLGLGIVASLMRHLWIGLGITLLSVAIFRPAADGRRIVSRLFRLAVPAVFVLSLVALLFSIAPSFVGDVDLSDAVTVIRERVVSIGNTTDESLVWRDEVWHSAIARFAERPVFGLGFGASVPVEFGDYRQYVEVRNMHNSWLALLIQTGIVGGVIFASFLGFLFFDLFRSASRSSVLLSAGRILTALAFFQGLVFFSQPYLETNLLGIFFWITLGLIRSLPDMKAGPSKGVTTI